MPGCAISLGEVAERTAMLEIACSCERRGRLRIARMIAEHGRDMPLPTLLRLLTDDSPQHAAISVNDRCGAHFPELPALFSMHSS